MKNICFSKNKGICYVLVVFSVFSFYDEVCHMVFGKISGEKNRRRSMYSKKNGCRKLLSLSHFFVVESIFLYISHT